MKKRDLRTPADICRANGWHAGTKLVGDEGHGPTVIEITAIGEQEILAKAISEGGEPIIAPEATWFLSYRDWQEVKP